MNKPKAATGLPSSNIDSLMARTKAGDRASFKALYDATASTLLGIGIGLLRDRNEAEDVLQDVFVAVWTKSRQFDPEKSSAMTWLASMTRHRAIDRLRSLSTLPPRAPLDLAETTPDSAPTGALYAEKANERARLDECLQALEDKRRDLIRVAFFEGLTYEELATRISAPLGSVKSWIRRGLLQLRACLEP